MFYSVVIGKETIYGDLNHWFMLYTRWRTAGVLHLALLGQLLTHVFSHDKIEKLLNFY